MMSKCIAWLVFVAALRQGVAEEEYNCTAMCPESLHAFEQLSCGPWGCLPYPLPRPEESPCLCPASAPCLTRNFGSWRAIDYDDPVRRCPFNMTLGGCDWLGAAAWAKLHGTEWSPDLTEVSCDPLERWYEYLGRGNGYWVEQCPYEDNRAPSCRYGGQFTSTVTSTTMTTSLGCTPELAPQEDEAECRPVGSMELFTSVPGACRGANAYDNCFSYYEVVEGIQNISDCTKLCADSKGCTGVEFSVGRCELWTREIGPDTKPLPGFTCLKKNDCRQMPTGSGVDLCGKSYPCKLSCPEYYTLSCDTINGYAFDTCPEKGTAWVLQGTGGEGVYGYGATEYSECCTCTLAVDFAFSPAEGGTDRSCVGSGDADDSSDDYVIYNSTNIRDVSDCIPMCVYERKCHAVEFRVGSCKIWKKPVLTTRSLAGASCLRYTTSKAGRQEWAGEVCTRWSPISSQPLGDITDSMTPMARETFWQCDQTTAVTTGEEASSIIFEPVDGGVDRACRGATPTDNSAEYFYVKEERSLAACKAQCIADSMCKGVEYSNGRCEIWTREQGGIESSKPLSGFSCLRVSSTLQAGKSCVQWAQLLPDANANEKDFYWCFQDSQVEDYAGCLAVDSWRPSGWKQQYMYPTPTVSADGASVCKDKCIDGGFAYFGMQCPTSWKVLCYCSNQLVGEPKANSFCEGRGEPLVQPRGECVGPYTKDGYRFGDAFVLSAYRTGVKVRSDGYAACIHYIRSWGTYLQIPTSAMGVSKCKERCASNGFPYFGLSCPRAMWGGIVDCKCGNKIDGTRVSDDWCEGQGTLPNGHGSCDGTYTKDGYRFGDYGVTAVYFTSSSTGEARRLMIV